MLNKIKKSLQENIITEIKKRLQEFQELKNKNNQDWFNELCFCLLTANSKAETAIKIQIEMSQNGFTEKTRTEIAYTIKKHGHRFHNTKAKYIFLARKFLNIKDILQNLPENQTRAFLVNNIKGLGYKEASHFLRNVGYNNFAIIDRHILRFLKKYNFINEIPKVISKKNYLEYEKILTNFNIEQSELDLILWAHMTGKVLK
ncbi:MAG: N-glycosylase/DNA lyase [candidate division TM6 bacterium GW2011_GWF2_28_16]|nr:MAG: N-glycosylase/DNA lyase [candidate division TM6 bacterium GW2011_GWF2_28_16]